MPFLRYIFDNFFVIWRYAIGSDKAQFIMMMKTGIHTGVWIC